MTMVQVEPRSFNLGHHKNNASTLSAMLPTFDFLCYISTIVLSWLLSNTLEMFIKESI